MGCIGLSWAWGGMADRAIIRQEGRIFAEVDLKARKQFAVAGPLGTTVIAVEAGRARVVADPGPRFENMVASHLLKRLPQR